MRFFEVIELLGYLLRVIGTIVFGLATGWITLRAFQPESKGWQLKVAAMLAFPASFVLLGHWVHGGATLGAYGLGAGAGIFIWGVGLARKRKRSKDD